MSDGERCAHCDHVRAAHVVVQGLSGRPQGCAACESCYTFVPQRPLNWHVLAKLPVPCSTGVHLRSCTCVGTS